MDTFIDSSWYFLRYIDPKNAKEAFCPKKVKHWMPVDEYVGGIEHAVLHLLYSRFVTKVLFQEGLVATKEPFLSLLPQGMVLKNGSKMSKSKGNVVSPMQIVKDFGADTARLFILFAAPPDKDMEWSDEGVEGCYRFLKRVYRLVVANSHLFTNDAKEVSVKNLKTPLYQKLNLTIKKVTFDIKVKKQFNTAISYLMELVNLMQKSANDPAMKLAIEVLLLLLAPFVPYLTEELWSFLGKEYSIHKKKWPQYDEAALIMDEIEILVQINGKLRGKVAVDVNSSLDDIKKVVLASQIVKNRVDLNRIKKVVVVPKKLVNIVV